MTRADVAARLASDDFYVIRADGWPIACVFGHGEADAYEIGKLAVAPTHRRQGLARRLIDAAGNRAASLGHDTLRLHARAELTENHAVYRALGFTRTATFTHPGFTRPTAFIFQRRLSSLSTARPRL